MELITSRKNRIVTHIRKLAGDRAYRRSCMEYVCDGEKFLREAVQFGAEVTTVLWGESAESFDVPGADSYVIPNDLMEYVSPLKNSPGPVFAVRIPKPIASGGERAIILETVQDPGNVGTVIRTAAALGIDRVLLCGSCADLYNPKTVRATMGAIFRQRVEEADIASLKALGVPIYGAALSDKAVDVRSLALSGKACAVAIGSEGRGLSPELLSVCDGEIIIPMAPNSESLNAAVAAAIVMWEMAR